MLYISHEHLKKTPKTKFKYRGRNDNYYELK